MSQTRHIRIKTTQFLVQGFWELVQWDVTWSQNRWLLLSFLQKYFSSLELVPRKKNLISLSALLSLAQLSAHPTALKSKNPEYFFSFIQHVLNSYSIYSAVCLQLAVELSSGILSSCVNFHYSPSIDNIRCWRSRVI